MESGDDRLTAGLLDLGLGRLGKPGRGDLERAAHFAVAEDLDRLLVGADQAVGREDLGVDLGDLGVERGEIADIHHRDLGAVLVIIEATMRQLAVERHLAALEAGADAAAGACGLALAALAARLAVAAAFAAADALLAV